MLPAVGGDQTLEREGGCVYINFREGPEVNSGLWRWPCVMGFFEHRKLVGGSGEVGGAFTEKAVLLPNLEKEEYVYEADERAKGRREQQNSSLVITTTVANAYQAFILRTVPNT